MKRNILLTISAIAAFAIILLIRQSDRNEQPVHPKLKYDLSTAEGLMAYAYDQKMERRRREASADPNAQVNKNSKYDKPDEAMALEVMLRSEIDGPYSYSGSYRFEALREARANRRLARREVLPWVERGPANVGGRTRAILVHPDSSSVWIAGAVGGGIWKTENAGQSWRPVSDDLPILSITALAQCDSQPNVTYAGTGEGFYNFDAVIGDGLFKSTDHGESWQQLNSTAGQPHFKYVNRIIVHPTNPDLLLVATNEGIYRSVDGGASWNEVYNPGGRVQHIIANPQNFHTQYAGINGEGVVKSTDGGVTWSSVGSFNGSFARIELAIAPSDTSVLYATLTTASSSLGGFYRSSNAGENWSYLGNSPNWLGGQGWYDNTLVVSPHNPNEIIVGGIDLYRVTANTSSMSVAKISNWYPDAGYPYVHADQHILVTIPTEENQYAIVAGNDGGVFYSPDNGNTWSMRDNGYNVTQFYDADKHPVHAQFLGGTQDNGTNRSPLSPDQGSSWDEVIGGDGFECAWNKYDGNIVYGSLYYSRLFKSTDGGSHFQSVEGGLPQSSVFYTSLAMDPRDSDVLLVVGDGNFVYRTADGGDNWEGIQGEFNGYSYKVFQFSAANSNIVWAAAARDGINVSTDHGRHFHAVTPPGSAPYSRVIGMGTHPVLDSTAFVTFGVSYSPKIFRTDDLGQSWTDLTNDLPNVPVHTLIVMPFDTSQIWVGTDIGLFISMDSGNSWAYADNGIPAVAIKRLKIVGQEIAAATHGRGIWSVHLDSLPPLEIPTLAPILAQIDPPPPNNTSIQIQFSTRSDHDSVQVVVNDQAVHVFGATTAYSELNAEITGEYGDTLGVTVVGYTDGFAYPSESQSVSLFAPVSNFAANFDSTGVLMVGDMESGAAPGFDSNILQTLHPYASGQNYQTYLAPPIIITEASILTYSDVALVEPGEPGSSYPDQVIWDYVTVEGSLDGSNWTMFIDPYDARFDDAWENAYNAGSDGSQNLLRQHSIDLNDFYATGDTIRIRFRLFADEYVTGWGWAIDDIVITSPTGLTSEQTIPAQFALEANYPNPFNASTTIPYSLSTISHIQMTVYDIRGRLVKTLISDAHPHPAGNYSITWDGTDENGHVLGSGVYYLRLRGKNVEAVRKVTMIK
ncbi:MAG: T9SS type A sorting domain-containing protein [Candidatus Marinimicrobia bacterium]|nr:T9SS type A sorting domain-containing protein [Candidatus Neomarinimicrobiota bacterium]MCF7840302.1 T9SS type A sorting domain-containing protein [Candidatus Neomarinimicrobiota bacterium]